jgi:hypothetical protein
MRGPGVSDPGKHRGDTWGPREVIALVIIVMSFSLAAIAQILDKPGASIPAWVAGLIAGIGLYYYKNGKEG